MSVQLFLLSQEYRMKEELLKKRKELTDRVEAIRADYDVALMQTRKSEPPNLKTAKPCMKSKE